MGFNDFAQAIQFGAGMLHGFQKQTEELRKHHETQQMELLKLLSQDETKTIEPIQQGDIVGEQGFFGSGALKTKEGHPAFRIGGNAFTIKPRPVLGGDEIAPAPSAPTLPSTPTPLKSQDLFQNVPSGPAQPVPAAPAATPDLQTSVPGKTPIQQYIVMKAKQLGIPPEIALAQAHLESGGTFNNAITGKEQEIGIFQIHPDTVAETGYTAEQLRNPKINIDAGLTYLKKQIDAYGGDINKGLARYNGDISGKNNYVANVQKFVPQYRQAASAIQPAVTKSQEQAAATPDTSMLVAGDAAPAPKEFTLPPAKTVEQAQVEAGQRVTQQFKGAQTQKEMDKFRAAKAAAEEKAFMHWHQEKKEVEADVKELRKTVHDPRVLDLLDDVKTIQQFDAVKNLIKVSPEQDYRGMAIDRMQKAMTAGKGQEAAIEIWKQLRRANYDDKEIKDIFELSGYADKKELAKAKQKADQQQEAEIKAIPAKQEAALPGLTKIEEMKAGIIKPNEEDIPAINKEMQDDIAKGKVPANITMQQYLKDHSGFLVNLQKEREVAKLDTPAAKLERAKRVLLEQKHYTENDPVIKALDQQIADLGRTSEEKAALAAEKAADVTKARAEATDTARAQRVQEAANAVEDLLSGKVKPPEGMTVDKAALQELTKRNLTPDKIDPSLAGRIIEAKPFKTPQERTSWVSPDYTAQNADSVADAKNKGMVELPKEEVTRFRLGNDLYTKMRRIEETMDKLGEIDPQWKRFQAGAGPMDRAKLAAYTKLKSASQSNPTVAGFLKSIDNDLNDININYGRFVSGVGGRPAVKLIEQSTKNLPNLEPSMLSWLVGGKQLDLPATMLTQLGIMKDMVRTTQDDVLVTSHGITPQEASSRREQRMEEIAHPERRQATTAPAIPTAVAPIATSAPAPSKGQQEFEEMMQRGKQ